MKKILKNLLTGGRISLTPWRFDAEGPLAIILAFVLALVVLLLL